MKAGILHTVTALLLATTLWVPFCPCGTRCFAAEQTVTIPKSTVHSCCETAQPQNTSRASIGKDPTYSQDLRETNAPPTREVQSPRCRCGHNTLSAFHPIVKPSSASLSTPTVTVHLLSPHDLFSATPYPHRHTYGPPRDGRNPSNIVSLPLLC